MPGGPSGSEPQLGFQDAAPFPTDGTFDNLLRAAVRFSRVLARYESGASTAPVQDCPAAREPGRAFPDSPLSPLTASSAGSPDGAARVVPEADEVSQALQAFLVALSAAGELATSSPSSDGPSSGASCASSEEDATGSSSSEHLNEGEPAHGGTKRKRKRRGGRGGKGKKAAKNNGHDDRRNGRKEYERRRRANRRRKDRADAANAPPYERMHKKSFYRNTHGVRLLNIRTFEVKYATGPGGYIGKKSFGRKVYSVEELKKMGFVELEWDGEDTILVLDRDCRIVCVLVGRPQGLTPSERAEWDAGVADLARAFEEERARQGDGFEPNLRGHFDAFAAGFTMGPGSKKPANLNREGSRHREMAERLLAHGQLRRLAGFASEAVAHYFPLAFLHVRDRLAALCQHDPSLKFPFGGVSLYPACTFNLGPYSVCFGHTDGSNYPGFPCTVSPFGSYDPALGGHFILFDFRLYFKFPQGTTVALSSAGMRHGNTRLAPGDNRYSFTQYLSGGMMRYISYGFRLLGNVSDEERERVDAEMNEGWEAQLSRFSTWSSVLVDRKRLYDHERGRC